MKAQSEKEKNRIKLLYAVALYKVLKDNPINSIRGLASEAGMEYSHLQRIARGKVNIGIAIHIAIIDALNISFSTFGKYYDDVSESDIQEFNAEIKKLKKLRGKK